MAQPRLLTTLLILSALTGPGAPALAFALRDQDGQSLHGQILREALSNKICAKNLEFISQSADRTAPEAKSDFFGKGNLKSGLGYVEREQKIILNYAQDADLSARSRYRTLFHVGRLMRVAQDFYSQSNYVELQAERHKEKLGPAFDPYQIELVDWSKLNYSEYLKRGNKSLNDGGRPKENAEEGKDRLGSATYYKVAKDLATRESVRQWDLLMALIRQKYPKRSASIITALKEVKAEPVKDDEID
ncbi:MAG: hypothetical protein IPO31_11885 [Candidatus Obscuribacter sp.]|nr:hypothetical protein [Candidatus Obscuribacter sp.]